MELVGLLVALTSIVVIAAKTHEVIYALLFGMILISLFSSLSFVDIWATFSSATFNADTLTLVSAVLLITLFSTVMYKTHLMDRLLQALINIAKDIYLLVSVIPALVGLLAVPGGAVMSVPFVDRLGDRLNMRKGHKSGINIFFRHVTVFFNPLSPLLIVVAEMSTLGFAPFIRFYLIPVGITLVLSYLLLRRLWPMPISDQPETLAQTDTPLVGSSLKDLAIAGFPIFFAIVAAAVFHVHFVLSISTAILFTLLIDQRYEKRLQKLNKRNLFFQGINWRLGLSVYFIILFGEFVKNSGSVPIIAELITGSDMPLLFVLIAASILVGFASGHPIVGSVIVYPVFIPLVGIENTAYLVLILSGMMYGYVISPIHLCLIASNEAFKANYIESYKILFPLQSLLLLASIITVFFFT